MDRRLQTRIFALLVGIFGLLGHRGFADNTVPALPLPDPLPDEIAVASWPEGRPLPNSVRAWHYNPTLVTPLLEVGRAVDDASLPLVTKRMLAAVVTSRNRCLY